MKSDAAVFSRGADHDLQALEESLSALEASDASDSEIAEHRRRIERMQQFRSSAGGIEADLRLNSDVELFECPQVAK